MESKDFEPPKKGEARTPLTDDVEVIVCDECLQASCWQGEFMCDGSRDAGIGVLTVGELRKLNRENEEYWPKSLAPTEPVTLRRLQAAP